MNYSVFGEKLSGHSGILDLMDDLGNAVTLHPDMLMLGGGNPSAIPEIQAVWRQCAQDLFNDQKSFDQMLVSYDPPQGNPQFLKAFADLFHREFDWPVTEENIAAANGAQTGMFSLLNLLAGRTPDGAIKKILIPLSPDYIGYADMGAETGMFLACPGRITFPDPENPRIFKYQVDFEAVRQALAQNNIAAMLVSRPTNPSGNVISREELEKLDRLANEFNVYLIIDNAYGGPFPGIMENSDTLTDVFYSERTVQAFSFSKIGLPGLRTAFIVAPKEIVKRLSAITAIVGLANGNFGQRLALPLFESGRILTLAREIVYPYYHRRRKSAVEILTHQLNKHGINWRLHSSEGAFFLWLWLPDLKESSMQLYRKLKDRGVLVIPGEEFFYGLPENCSYQPKVRQTPYCRTCGSDSFLFGSNSPHGTEYLKAGQTPRNIYIDGVNQNRDPVFEAHQRQCLRISFSAPEEILKKGFAVIAETAASLES